MWPVLYIAGPILAALVYEWWAGRGPARGPDAPVWNVASNAVSRALSVVGSPYTHGGSDPTTGFDCSGLVTWAFGLPEKMTAGALRAIATPVSPADIRPGDLLFYDWSYDGEVDHVVIYTGQGQVVAAVQPGTGVETQSLYTTGLVAIGRL